LKEETDDLKRIFSVFLIVFLFASTVPMVLAQSKVSYAIDPQFDDVTGFQEGMAFVKLNDKWGVIDNTGKIVVKPQFDDYEDFVYRFSEGMAQVSKDGKWGYIDKTGTEIVSPQYEYLGGDFKNGLATVFVDGQFGYINKSGKVVIEPQNIETSDFFEGLAMIRELDGGEYSNRSYSFSEGLAIVGEDLNRVIIDMTGKEVAKLQQYDGNESFYVSGFIEGLALIRTGDDTMFRWGFINSTGQEVIKGQYDDAYSFQEGLAWVKIGEKWGAIDNTGKEVITPKYDGWSLDSDLLYEFIEGVSFVRQGSKFGYIDKTGKELTGLQFDQLVKGLLPFKLVISGAILLTPFLHCLQLHEIILLNGQKMKFIQQFI
jgi:hypothetical protein